MRNDRAFVLDKDKADEFLRQKADTKLIERIYRNADKFEKNNTNHIYSKGYNKAIDDFTERLRLKCIEDEYNDVHLIQVLEIAKQLKG